MRLLSHMNEKIVFVRFLFATLRATKGILWRVVQLLVCTVHGEIFEDNLAMETFEQPLDLTLVHLRLLIMAVAQVVGLWWFMLVAIGGLIFEGRLAFALPFDVLVGLGRRQMILVRFTFNTRGQEGITAAET